MTDENEWKKASTEEKVEHKVNINILNFKPKI
jgi:hypothetical protein